MFGEIKNSRSERLDYTFHAGDPASRNLVVLGHGVTGNKDRPFIIALASGLAAAGLPVLRVSFSGNGASGGRFVDSHITKEVADLGAVLDALAGRTVCYVGHSMGGAVGVVRASQDARIHLLVSLAGMVHTQAFAHREFGQITPDADNMWDDPACPLSKAYMDDLTRLDSVVNLAPHIKVPWLFVHGTEDDVVPMQDTLDIFAAANEPKEFIDLPGSGHVFSGDFTPVMVDRVVGWIKARLK